MKSIKFLEMIKKEQHLKSDRQLAILLGKGTNTISQYMAGQRVMDDETCLAVALQLGIDPMQVVGAACIDRAEKTGQNSLWEVFMQRMATPVSAVLVGVALAGSLTFSENSYAENGSKGTLSAIIKRLRKMLRWQLSSEALC